MNLETATEILKKHWKHDSFRPAQAQAIQHALDGQDVLCVLPTSFGKSACFQVPAIMSQGCALVISPLIALMKDQVGDCLLRGISASYVNSHISDAEAEVRFKKWTAGEYKLFYVSPERLGNKAFQKAVVESRVSYLIMDECHMVSLAGHAYRPAYRKIHDIIPLLSYTNADGQFVRPPILGFTATATPLVADDIAKSAGMDTDYKRVIADPIRSNIKYEVDHRGIGSWQALKQFFISRVHVDGRFVVYLATQKGTSMACDILRQFMPHDRVAFYHGGMNREDRERVQDAFKSGTVRIVCATNAFGMGIDVPDIRAVMHLGISGSLEAYCQEAGRGGRDGKHTVAVLVPDVFTESLQKRFIEWENPAYNVYVDVWDWLNKTCSPGELIKMSTISMAKAISPHGKDGLNGESVAAVLRTMHAYGMVERSPIPFGSVATISTKEIMNATTTAAILSPKVLAVAQAVWELQKKKMPKPYPETFEAGINKEELAEAAGVNLETVGRAFRVMTDKGILTTSPADYGKTTEIIKYGESLEDILPEHDIKHRRKVAVARLDAMIGYTHAKPGEHVARIRAYFMGKT